MHTRCLTAFLLTGALTACAGQETQPDPGPAAEQAALDVVSDRFPLIDGEPVARCIRDNATFGEQLTLAKAALTGVTTETVETALTVAQRPDAQTCIIDNGIPAALAALIGG
ncbi:MAG: succinate dehydrogenase [Pseudomonadota bacterium]